MKSNINNMISQGLNEEKKYTTEEINKQIKQVEKQSKILVFILDYIRNYRELTPEMLEIINKIDDTSKMIIIKEYNNVIKELDRLLT